MGADNLVIRAQPGPQEDFLKSPSDIVIYGGGAGGGKTYALLLEALRHIHVPGFGAVIFRRESVQITNEGGLWDNAMALYPLMGGRPFKAPQLGFRFGGAKITFAHLNQENDVLGYQGSQIPLIAFDELTHFERSQFFYLLSRNRSTCGVRPYIRATCNPDADSWVADFIAWWIDQDTGLPIPERAGRLRYFVRMGDTLHWADSPAQLTAAHGCDLADAKSVTFIPATIYDNRALLAIDPGYLANLKAMVRVERERLLGGNWKIRPASGLYFPRHSVTVIDKPPADLVEIVRAWDLAATPPTEDAPSPDATAAVKMGRTASGRFVVLHVAAMRERAHDVRRAMLNLAEQDGQRVRVSLPQDPGQAGKDQAEGLAAMLAGYRVSVRRPTGDKITRAEPFAAQWQAGNVDVLRGPWTEAYLSELEAFPVGHDDQVDASSDAFTVVAQAPGPLTLASGRTRTSATLLRGYA